MGLIRIIVGNRIWTELSPKVKAIHGGRYLTRAALGQAVLEYIEVDYNRTRRHSASGYVSPEAFEAQRVA